nr:immunoglobulin light chain junction region [Macaca mulatta]MOW09222.1 immunoglobulin light chain junction region [Macaca mulatta]MOW10431.1 immunoglobulin light chain junction region [Macaca mulatta]MOW11248.1 immunoglobulin light chain junction region [Macaca mulatta]MOW12765.1 immunoglobulin light chain junction region [Macaca mulatta]
CQHYSIWPYSF